jgi:hypothetical protein
LGGVVVLLVGVVAVGRSGGAGRQGGGYIMFSVWMGSLCSFAAVVFW